MATISYSFQRLNGPDRLNVTTDGNQWVPAVVATSGGAGIVFFFNSGIISARRLAANGEPTGAEVALSATSAGDLEATRLSNGNVVVTWSQGLGGSAEILGRIYSPNLTPVSGILTFETLGPRILEQPDIAATADGGFVVVSNVRINATDADIYISKFNSAGVSTSTQSFTPVSLDSDPSVAVLANGNVAVAWEREVGSETEIWYGIYGPTLEVVRAPQIFDTTGTRNRNVVVAARPDGTFTISYEDNAAGSMDISTYQLTAAGGPIDFDETASTSADNTDPTVATSPDGHQVVMSEDRTSDVDRDIRGSILTPGGQLLTVTAAVEIASGLQFSPDVAWIDASTIQLAYSTSGAQPASDGNGLGVAVSRFAVARTTTGDGTSETLAGGAGFRDVINGLGGNDTINGGPGFNTLNGGVGDDTAVFSFSLAGATLTGATAAGNVTISSPGASNTMSGVERYRFTDGQINAIDGNALVDDLFYFFRNKDVFAAQLDAEAHYLTSGWREGRDPNAFFSSAGYLGANQDVKAAGINPLAHYDQDGWREGRDPSASFDTTLYLLRNADVRNAGIDPLAHYLASGQAEGRAAFAAIGKAPTFTNGTFDAEFYLLSNADVARAVPGGANAFAFADQHYRVNGWREGRDPNAFFDVDGYRNAYADVRNANIDPLAHYDSFGWRERRDPSGAFDTRTYLQNSPDVAVAGVNPLLHYLQAGAYEGRPAYGDGVFFTA